MRVAWFLVLALVTGCVDVSKICPYKPITQGVFGEVVDANGAIEQNVEVDLYTILNGVKDMEVVERSTGRGGYQIDVNPSMYMLCAKDVCTTVTIPTGIVELSASDTSAGLTWDAPVSVPPEEMIGPCTYGNEATGD